jgi:glyoxylase-like metal-dependent hydrolase (beta-lactamase superfamily II)
MTVITPDTETPLAGLHATAPAPLPFAPSLHIRAFVLQRSEGNVLMYSAPTLGVDDFGSIGGIARAYLNHRHEAAFGDDLPGLPLFVHRADRDAVAARRTVRGAFSRRHTLGDDLEVIPTPGHTPGATTYLWANGEHRFLFTGDTIYLRDGEWVAAVLDSSDRAAYLDSLELIRDLDYDVLVPWAATAGEPYYAVTSHREARSRVDAILERVRRGEDQG